MDFDLQKLRQYFLGELQVDEADEIERRIISDAVFEESLITAENALVEDYLDGTLSAEEAQLFKSSYLITPGRCKNVELVAYLREHSKAKAVENVGAKAVVEGKVSFIERLKSFFLFVPKPAYAACLLLLIFAAIGYIWLEGSQEFERSQADFEALNARDFGDLNRYRDFPGIGVLPGGSRGTGSTIEANEIGSTDSVFVRLGVPIEFKDYNKFNLRLIKEGKAMFSLELIKPYESGGGKELRFLIPANVFTKGGYRFEVAPAEKPDSLVSYYLTVE